MWHRKFWIERNKLIKFAWSQSCLVMHVVHSTNQLLKEPACFIFFETTPPHNEIKQVSTGSKFHGNANMLWCQKHLRYQATISVGRHQFTGRIVRTESTTKKCTNDLTSSNLTMCGWCKLLWLCISRSTFLLTWITPMRGAAQFCIKQKPPLAKGDKLKLDRRVVLCRRVQWTL